MAPARPGPTVATFTSAITADGTLSITNGGSVSNATGYIGYYSGSSGMVTVDGAGSTWTNSGDLYVGNHGSGTLSISNGGSVSVAGSTYVGWGEGSLGAIQFGANGGTLTSQSLFVSPTQLTGNGTINTHGLVSDVDLIFDATHPLDQTFAFTDSTGHTVTVNLDMTGGATSNGALGAGYLGNGSLTIRDGITVNSSSGYIGYQSGSSGVATVDGAGSTWTNSGTLCRQLRERNALDHQRRQRQQQCKRLHRLLFRL